MSTTIEVRLKILNRFTKTLVASGYPRVMTARIIRNGVVSYMKDVAKHKAQIRNIHTSAAQGMYLRRLGKLVDKSELFRKEKEEELGVEI